MRPMSLESVAAIAASKAININNNKSVARQKMPKTFSISTKMSLTKLKLDSKIRQQHNQQHQHQNQQQQQQTQKCAQKRPPPPTTTTVVKSQQPQLARVASCARAKTLTAKLIDSHGAELRRALFSLRQTFQDDKELAVEFVISRGVDTLLRVAHSTADQIHQNYILRAIGQLAVDASNASALCKHSETLQWLYSLLTSQHRLIVRAALKLLLQLVDVAATSGEHQSVCGALKAAAKKDNAPVWANVVRILDQRTLEPGGLETADLLADAMKFVNKTLNLLPDQDTYYDFVDPLEEQRIESCINRLMSTASGNEPLIEQLKVYEQVLSAEDADEDDDEVPAAVQRKSRRYLNKQAAIVEVAQSPNGTKLSKTNQATTITETESVVVAMPAIATTSESDDVYESANDDSQDTVTGASTCRTGAGAAGTSSQQTKTAPQTGAVKKPLAASSTAQATPLGRRQGQRASISSCSSSDSYNSYGSGYVSGSGNSTDHAAGAATTNGNGGSAGRRAVGAEPRKKDDVDDDDDDEDVDDDDDDDDDDGQLERHLNELEQLTDELAKRAIIGATDDAEATRLKKAAASKVTITNSNNNKSATLKSTSSELSSAGSSILSTGSSSVVPGGQMSPATAPTDASSAGSRSASATPTAQATSKGLATTAAAPQTIKRQEPQTIATPGSKTKQQQQQSQDAYQQQPFQWEQLVSRGVSRPLLINDLDFTDLQDEDDDNDLLPRTNNNANQNFATGASQHNLPPLPSEPLSVRVAGSGSGTSACVPPPLPPPPSMSPWFDGRPASMVSPTPSCFASPGARGSVCGGVDIGGISAASVGGDGGRDSAATGTSGGPVGSLRAASSMSSLLFGANGGDGGQFGRFGKRKKTMKLFWKEVREDKSLLARLTKKRTIWDEVEPIKTLDTSRLEYLFESKAKDLLTLSRSRLNGLDTIGGGSGARKAKIVVLDAKRSNAINIGMTKLPPMRTIKSAILKMDSTIMNREGIEKILTTMLPSEEEKQRIIEAQLANPDTPLGTAEQFLLNLASISALEARLKLWAFQLDYAQIEKEVAEPLMDLKQAIGEIERSETFRVILGTLLAIGNFLNSTNAKGFQLDYLEKVAEVKDTVHKHSLLHHLCVFIEEKYGSGRNADGSNVYDDDNNTSGNNNNQGQLGDLYSEFGAVSRASKVDYTEVAQNLKKMQQDCKASWDYLKIVAKHDGLASLMNGCLSSASASTTSTTTTMSSCDSGGSKSGGQTTGKLNNLSKLAMITSIAPPEQHQHSQSTQKTTNSNNNTKQMKTKVSDFLTDCAERIMVLVVIHRRVMNRFQKLLVYLGCPSHQIKQMQPQQMLKIINEFALEYRTKRERVREMLARQRAHNNLHQHQHHQHHPGNHLCNAHRAGNATSASASRQRWLQQPQVGINNSSLGRWSGSQQSIGAFSECRPTSSTSSYAPSECCCCSSSGGAGGSRALGGQLDVGRGLGCQSPSQLSQASNFSDYSRQSSATPVAGYSAAGCRRPHSMSASMLDLPGGALPSLTTEETGGAAINDEQIRRDEQLRRLLGGGSSMDSATSDLYQLSHWTSTLASVSRNQQARQRRAASIDAAANHNSQTRLAVAEHDVDDRYKQSSYYRHLADKSQKCLLDEEQNSEDELFQSLVKSQASIVARASANRHHHHHHQHQQQASQQQQQQATGASPLPHQKPSHHRTVAKSKLLSRFDCDRKLIGITLRNDAEAPSVR